MSASQQYDFFHHSTQRPPKSSAERRRLRSREKASQHTGFSSDMFQEAERPALHTMAYSGRNAPYHAKPVSTTSPSSVMDAPDDRIVYSDPYEAGSVMTGMSQQELIRKKVRETKKKQRYSSSKRKKKKITVVQILPNILGSTSRTPSSSIEKEDVQPSRSSKRTSDSNWKILRRSSNDDLEHSTAESTVTDVSQPRGRTVRDTFGPAFSADFDHRSLGEDSFPLLSRNATNGDVFVDEQVTTVTPLSPSRPRGVRFAAQIVAPPVQRRTLVTEPQSILRATPRFQATFIPSWRPPVRASPSRPSPAWSLVIEGNTNRSPAMASSPPRNGFGFVDQQGKSLSPIRPSSHWLRHPAEKALDVQTPTTVASLVARTNGEDDYPDPPLELNMDDESTVASTRNGFLEVVAAIVVQTAFRRFMAMRYVDDLKEMIAEEMHAQYLRQREAQLDQERQMHQRNLPSVDETIDLFEPRTPPRHRSSQDPRENPVDRRHEAQAPSPPHDHPATPPAHPSTDRALGNDYNSPSRPGDKPTSPQSTPQITDAVPSDSPQAVALDMYNLAAIRIQSAFRGFWARDSLDVDHYCATLIQKSVRTYFLRKKFLLTTSHAAVTIQSMWRRSLTRDHVAATLGAIIFIQAIARGYFVRKEESERRRQSRLMVAGKDKSMRPKTWQQQMVTPACEARKIGRRVETTPSPPRHVLKPAKARRANTSKEELAALRIQSRYRSYVCEMDFIRSLVDVLIVQTVVRRWLAKRRVEHIRAHVVRSDASGSEMKSGSGMQQPMERPPSNAETDLLAMWRSKRNE